LHVAKLFLITQAKEKQRAHDALSFPSDKWRIKNVRCHWSFGRHGALGGITTHFRTGGVAYRFPKIVKNHQRAHPFPYANYLAEWHQVFADQGRIEGKRSWFSHPNFTPFSQPVLGPTRKFFRKFAKASGQSFLRAPS